jgi:hypothetical protein
MSSATSSYSVVDPTYGRLGQHINMYHKLQLDWIAPARRLEVNDGESETATIDASAFAGSPNFYVARLPIPGSSRYYTVEVRKRIGNYDGNLPGDVVIIHYVVVGETFTDEPENIVVRILSETANGFVVEIDRDGPDPNLDFGSGFE